ncbi:hypothetical protein [Mycolicibacterium hippocampi]|uniref:hypothetical protein n=1 Tax=Mycolicibacterium hippocampi TaxID=659824 RepID=UPI001F22D468|nr:hypothetical protein [Mycolicibacterium hippocampi]
MAVFDRLSIRVTAVGAGLCGIALALSPGVAQAGGYECLQTSAGEVPAAGAVACAPISEMSGVPMALPGPLAPPPVVPPLAPPPVVPPIVPPLAPPPIPPVVPPLAPPPVVPPLAPPPVVPPLAPPVAPLIPAAAPVAGGLPMSTMGGLAGKGDSTGPAPTGAPVPGQPITPGPGA